MGRWNWYTFDMMQMYIDHLVLIVRNIKETENFYSAFLGRPEHSGDDSVVYKKGETKIFFVLPTIEFIQTDKDKSGLNHLAFGVKTADELKSLEKSLNDSGVTNSGIKIDTYGNNEFIWFDDPNGYRLEFYCRP